MVTLSEPLTKDWQQEIADGGEVTMFRSEAWVDAKNGMMIVMGWPDRDDMHQLAASFDNRLFETCARDAGDEIRHHYTPFIETARGVSMLLSGGMTLCSVGISGSKANDGTIQWRWTLVTELDDDEFGWIRDVGAILGNAFLRPFADAVNAWIDAHEQQRDQNGQNPKKD